MTFSAAHTGRLAAAAMLAAMSAMGIGGKAASPTDAGEIERPADVMEDSIKGYGITPTGLEPEYPKGYACSR